MKSAWTWLFAAVLWLSLALIIMWLVARPVAVKASPKPITSLLRPQTEDWFSAYPATYLLIVGQDPIDPEQGNPSHLEPQEDCAMSPKAGTKMIKCNCVKYQKCDSETHNEPTQCKSYCYRSHCTCPKPCE